jgi:hypothetical protein
MRTLHCERVRKMPLSGLNPTLLIGALRRDEAEWVDLRRMNEVRHSFVVHLACVLICIHSCPVRSSPFRTSRQRGSGADDNAIGLKSISDPEKIGGNAGEVSSASHAPSSSA